jgi:hypothetical protein
MSSSTTNRNINIYLNSSPAIKELNKLEDGFRSAKSGLKGLTQGTKQWQDQLNKIDEAGDKLVDYYKKLDLTGLSIKKLKSLSIQMRNMKDDITPGTAAANSLAKSLERVELQMHKARKSSGDFWEETKKFAIGAGLGNIVGNLATQAFSSLVNFIPNVIRKNAELADSQADVRRYTGLTSDEIDDLNTRLKAFDTRTPRSELLKLAGEAGKIGISGVQNIEKFVKEADQIHVALGDDLGDGAITQIAKLNNLWQTDKVYGYGQALTKTGSAINSLGQDGIATEAYIVDATTRLGGMAAQAKILQTDVLGLSAGMEEFGITSELGTTAVNQLWADMLKNSAHYAKVAKMDLTSFSKLLKTDFNEAFLRVLQGLGGTTNGLEGLVNQLEAGGVEGSRATAVFASLSANVDKLRDRQKFANKEFSEGTSIIAEFNTKNNNLAGSWEKVGKAISSWWTNSSLNSGISTMVTWFEKLIVVKKKLSDQITSEMIDLNTYRVKIMDVNTSQADRVKLIKELQAMYPQYLSNLDAETVSNNTLAAAIENVNKKLLVQQAVSRNREDMADDIDNLIKFQNRMSSKEVQLRQLLGSFSAGRSAVLKVLFDNKLGDAYNNRITDDIVKKADARIKQLQLEGEDITKIGLYVANLIQTSGKDQNMGVTKVLRNFWNEIGPYGSVTKLYNDAKANVDKQIKDAADMEKRLTDSLGIVEPVMPAPAPATATGDGKTPTGEKTKRELKEYDLLLEKFRDLNQRLADFKQEFEGNAGSELAGKIAGVQKKYRELLDDNSDSIDKLGKQEDEARKKADEARKGGFTKEAKHYDEQANKLKAQQYAFLQARFDIECQAIDNEQKVKDEYLADQVKKAKEAEDKMLAARQEGLEKIKLAVMDPLQKEIYETEKYYDTLIALAKEYGEDTEELERKRLEALEEIQKKDFSSKLDKFVEYYQHIAKLSTSLIDLANSRADREIAASDKSTKAQIKKWDEYLRLNLISQEQHDHQVQLLQEEQDKKTAELRKEQFERKRLASISEVIINTAIAVSKAWAELGPVLGPIMAGVIGATGAAQIATIMNEPAPSYGEGIEGGMLLKGKKHRQGGMPVLDGYGKKVAELEGGEPIFSHAAYVANRDLFDWLFHATKKGKSVRYQLPAFAMTQMPSFNAQSMTKAVNFAYGRTASATASPGSVATQSDLIAAQLTGKMEELLAATIGYYKKVDEWQSNLSVTNSFVNEDRDRNKLTTIKRLSNVFYKNP